MSEQFLGTALQVCGGRYMIIVASKGMLRLGTRNGDCTVSERRQV